MTETKTYARELAALEEVCDIAINVESLTAAHTFELVLLRLAGDLVAARDAEDYREAHAIESTLTDISSAFSAVVDDQQRADDERDDEGA